MDLKVSVVIPNYNGLKFLSACLRSLEAQTMPHRVIVVDNASADGSAQWLEQNHPQVECIRMPGNEGFASAVNAGIRAANTPYVVLLNNDTEAQPGWLEALVQAAQRREDIFSVSSLMLAYTDPSVVDDAGDCMTVWGKPFQRGNRRAAKRYGKRCQVLSACGGAAIYNRAHLQRVGLFNETFFAYLEDVDLGLRARLHGYKNYYEPRARVLHIGSATSNSIASDFKIGLSARNKTVLLRQDLAPWMRCLLAPFLAWGRRKDARDHYANGYQKAYDDGVAQAQQRLEHPVENYKGTKIRHQMALFFRLWQGSFKFLGYKVSRRGAHVVRRLRRG